MIASASIARLISFSFGFFLRACSDVDRWSWVLATISIVSYRNRSIKRWSFIVGVHLKLLIHFSRHLLPIYSYELFVRRYDAVKSLRENLRVVEIHRSGTIFICNGSFRRSFRLASIRLISIHKHQTSIRTQTFHPAYTPIHIMRCLRQIASTSSGDGEVRIGHSTFRHLRSPT